MTLAVTYSDRAPQVYGPYSQAITAGDLIYVSGQIPVDPVSMEVVTGGIEEQATQALANLRIVLQTAGSDLDRVVKTTVFLVDFADYAGLNAVYARAFGDHRPARSTVGVSSLPRGVRVEIEAVAVKRLVFPGTPLATR
jgi:2-iminobutanoate/2-iminopropanoate deaminase